MTDYEREQPSTPSITANIASSLRSKIFNFTAMSKQIIRGMMVESYKRCMPLVGHTENTKPSSLLIRLNSSTLLAIAMLLFQMASIGYAAPTSPPSYQPTIQNPCGLNFNSDYQQPYTEFPNTVKNNRATVRSAIRSVQTLSNLYKENLSSRTVRRLSDTSRYRLPQLQTDSNTSPADTEDQTVWTDTSNQKDVFTKHHYDTTVLIVYIHQAINEQNRYDNGYMVSQLRDVETALLTGVLCGQDTALRQMGQPATEYADSDDIPSELRNQNLRTRRYQRDFIVTNNIHNQLSLMEEYYDRLYTILTAEDV